MTSKKVSIITAIYNADTHLEQTIRSIAEQTYKNIEHIIVDGLSTDNSMAIVNNNLDSIAVIVSEKDKGIYDAWNKGLALATGDVISFCNGDDYLDSKAVENALKQIDDNKPTIVYGNVRMMDTEQGLNNFEEGSFLPSQLYRGFGFRTTTVFFNRTALEVNGTFNDTYRIAGDSDWLLRAYNNKILFRHACNLTYMRLGGISNKYEAQAFLEYCRALLNNSRFQFKSLIVLFKKIVKQCIRRVF